MARYDFICDECGNTRTVDRKIADRNDPLKCDAPQGNHRTLPALMRRMISQGTGFTLKGSGWYADGYSKNKGTGQ